MLQAKFSLEQWHFEFLGRCKDLGFKDKSAMVRAALAELRDRLEYRRLEESAALYVEEYNAGAEVGDLAEGALDGWPDDAD